MTLSEVVVKCISRTKDRQETISHIMDEARYEGFRNLGGLDNFRVTLEDLGFKMFYKYKGPNVVRTYVTLKGE